MNSLLVPPATHSFIRLFSNSLTHSLIGILARAAKGIKPSFKVKGSGSIVINDYENSQYYGEIQLGKSSLVLKHYSLTHSLTH